MMSRTEFPRQGRARSQRARKKIDKKKKDLVANESGVWSNFVFEQGVGRRFRWGGQNLEVNPL
jgi:hypothetical protein